MSVSVERPQHTLHVEVAGAGEPVFLLLHGLVDTLAIWDRVAPALAEGARVACVDQRGHGRSSAPPGPCSRRDLAGDVAAVLDALEAPRAVLVGHSMGGIVSMATALAHPDRVAGLVLIGTASRCNEKTAGWYERIAASGEKDGLEGLARSIYGRDTKRTVDGDAQGIAHVTRTLTSLFHDPLTPQLGDVACPARLLVGEKDPMGPRASEAIAEAIPDASLDVLPGLGHWIHREQPEAVLDACAHWRNER